MAAHEHRDAKLGFVYRYHPRSDAHSKELCRLVLEDLVAACPSLRVHAEADHIVYGINCLYTFPISGKTKTLDFVIAKGKPEEVAERIGGAIAPAALLGTKKIGNRKIKQLAVERVLISCESKAVMTEHSKSKPRLFDELSSSHEIVHQGDPEAIAAGITVVNIAKTFVSPTRQKGGDLVVTPHRQPDVTRQMVEHLRGLPIRTDRATAGFDAYATIVIDCDNQKVASLWTEPPAPQVGDRDHYDTFLLALSQAYEDRFGEKSV
ncbi:MAG: hypothetical protein ACYC3I_00135 [Gemmataceae bacterium]